MIDTMMAAHFHRLEDVALGSILRSGDLPNTQASWERLQARPSYEVAVLSQHSWEWRAAMEDVYGNEVSPYLGLLKEEIARNRVQA